MTLKLGSIDHGPDTDQFLVYHKFGNLVENAEDKLEAVEMYKKRLHTDINPRYIILYMLRSLIIISQELETVCRILHEENRNFG